MELIPRQQAVAERITTGEGRIDGILGGGLPRYSTVFITGQPGSGKTVLSQQAAFANARAGHTSLYLTTLSEPPLKLLRFLQGFTFFDAALFGTRVIYGDLGSVLTTEGPAGLIARLDSLVREHRPTLVVIDSFKVLRESFSDTSALRQFVLDVSVRLATWEVTSLLVGEYSTADLREAVELTIADGIIHLYGTEEVEQQRRYLRVMKMRGTGYFGGEHYFEIAPSGISLYPRMRPGIVGEYAVPRNERAGSAIEGLNGLLGGGLPTSTATLISGPTGCGKSLVALSFLVEAARRGERGLLVSLEESPHQLTRNARAFGWEVPDLMDRGLLDMLHVSPFELVIDRHAYEIKERAAARQAQMVVIDSITTLKAAIPDAGRYQSYLWAITDHFKRTGVTLLLINEAMGPFEAMALSAQGMSFLVDNVIFLRYVEVLGEIKRAIGVLKVRGSTHDRFVYELVIDPPRLVIGPRLEHSGMLGATMR